MPFTPITGSGIGGAIAVDDPFGVQTVELIRTNFDDHEERIDDLEAAVGATSLNANNLTSGTVPDARFPATLPAISGANLTNLDASDLASGTVPVARIGDGTLTYAKIQDIAAASRLLGRGSAAGSGDVQEIALGSGLTMTGTTLSASGGGGAVALDDLTDVTITTPASGQGITYNGSAWVNGTIGNVVGVASSVDAELVLFDSTTGKVIKRGTGTGYVHVTSGVVSVSKLKRVVGMMIGDGTNVISTGVQGFVTAPVTGTIVKVRLLSSDAAATSGSIVVDIWKDSYANYPPTVADTITASAKPTITTTIKSEDSTLTGWTTSVTAGDVFGFNVDSVTSLKRVTVELHVEES
jgi:hypothetical protein